jgi:hypothetical protein
MNPTSPSNVARKKPNAALEGHVGERSQAVKCCPFKSGVSSEGCPFEYGVGLKGRPIEPRCHEHRVVVFITRDSSKDLLKERLGDHHSSRIDLAGFVELPERRVPLLLASVDQALGSRIEANPDAALFIACRPVDASLVHHAPPCLDRLTVQHLP